MACLAPSFHKKIKEKGSRRYQWNFATCRKIFITLKLAKFHLSLIEHKILAMKAIQVDYNTESQSDTKLTEDAPFINTESFLKIPVTFYCKNTYI